MALSSNCIFASSASNWPSRVTASGLISISTASLSRKQRYSAFMSFTAAGRCLPPSPRCAATLRHWKSSSPTVASDDRDALARAVNDKTKIVLARDVHGLLDQHALHALPLRTGLGGDQGPTDHFIGRRAHFFNGVGQLDATGLAAAAGVALRLDHEAADAEFLGHGHRLFHAVRHAARGHRYGVLAQQLLRLVLVDIHATISSRASIRSIFATTTSAWRIEAASSMRPSSITAP